MPIEATAVMSEETSPNAGALVAATATTPAELTPRLQEFERIVVGGRNGG